MRTFASLWIDVSELGLGCRWESQTRTKIMVKSSPSHAEILEGICSTEANHVTIPPLLALTLQPHTPLHSSSSLCSTKSHNCAAHSPSVSRPVHRLLEHSPSSAAQLLVPVWYTVMSVSRSRQGCDFKRQREQLDLKKKKKIRCRNKSELSTTVCSVNMVCVCVSVSVFSAPTGATRSAHRPD